MRIVYNACQICGPCVRDHNVTYCGTCVVVCQEVLHLCVGIVSLLIGSRPCRVDQSMQLFLALADIGIPGSLDPAVRKLQHTAHIPGIILSKSHSDLTVPGVLQHNHQINGLDI